MLLFLRRVFFTMQFNLFQVKELKTKDPNLRCMLVANNTAITLPYSFCMLFINGMKTHSLLYKQSSPDCHTVQV